MYALIVESLGFLTLVALGAAGVLAVTALLPGNRFPARLVRDEPRAAVGVAFACALLATAGSLYFSEVVGFAPCELCWFQRIAMYPLVIVLGVAVLRDDADVWRTALPLTLIGGSISAYHVMVQWRPSLELTPCSGGVPCSARYVLVSGFVSIPVMAGAVFLLVTALMIAVATRGRPDAPVQDRADPS